MKFTFGNLPSIGWTDPPGRLVDLARLCEEVGFDRFGVSDWRFYHDMSVVMTACLQATRTLEVELHEDGQLVATPSVRVTLGRPAAVTMGGYSLRFRLEQASGGDYVIRSSLYRSEGGWTRLAAPTLTVAEGEQARARFAAADGSDLSLAVLVR